MAALRFAAAPAAVASLALAGCGGGGGGAAALPPVAASSTPGAAVSPQAVSFTIAIPAATSAASSRRRPAYVSPGTKSATVTVGGTSQSVNCANTCNLTLTVPTGTQTFTATLFGGTNGTGSALASGSTTTTIVAGAPNVVQIVFGGIPAKISIALGTPSVTAGTPASIPVTVAAQDAAGYTIVGADPYAVPIALSDDDASGATSLSTTSVASPATPVTLRYDGSPALSAAHLSASLPGAGSQSATLSVAQPAAPVAAAAAIDHVKNFAYYGLNDMDADIPASYMAAHVDIVDDDGISAQHADAFKKAGGKIALAYTDPTFVPYCPAPFLPPAGLCKGPIGSLVASDESAWLHDASGARINRYNDAHFLYQEILDVGSASAQHAYAQTAAAVLAQSPLLDGFEADDSGSPLASLYGGFSASASVELPTDASWIAGEGAMLAAAGKPVIVNGGDPATWGPSYNGAFVDLSAVMGQMFEGCFNNGDSGPYTDDQSRFQREANGLLAVQAHRKLALCMPTGKTDPASRLYAYASFLLAYDPAYSVFGMNQKQSDGESLYPETQLVPQQPRATATDVAQLKNGGVYVREFAVCTIAGTSIGPCAAVVNSSPSATATIPALSIAYAHSVALDAASLYGGGKVNVVAGTPARLGPVSAAILVR